MMSQSFAATPGQMAPSQRTFQWRKHPVRQRHEASDERLDHPAVVLGISI